MPPERTATGLERLIPAVLIGVAVAAVYVPHVARNGFVFDDHAQISEDPYVTGRRPLLEAFAQDVWANARPRVGEGHRYYRPIFVLTNRLVYSVAGDAPWAYHTLGLALFLASAWLGYTLLVALQLSRPVALAATALYALHPLAGEAVYWAGCLGELVLQSCLLGALLLMTAAARGERRSATRAAAIAGGALLTGAALLSKETAVVIAPIATLLALAGPRRGRRAGLLATLPLWLVTLGYLALRSAALGPDAGVSFHSDPWWSVTRAGYALAWDLRHLILPLPLSPFHAFPLAADPRAAIVGGAALLALAVAALLAPKLGPRGWFWGGWILLPLLPRLTQLFFSRQTGLVVAERYLLLSLLPVLALAVRLAAGAARRFSSGAGGEAGRRSLAALLGIACLGSAIATHRYGYAFVDDAAYFAHANRISPDHPLVLASLGALKIGDGDSAGALPLLERAVRLEPRRAQAQLNLGLALRNLGRLEEAVAALERAISLDGSIAGAHGLLADALRDSGRLEEAGRHYALEVTADPRSGPARVNLGTYLFVTGDLPGAVEQWTEAAELEPSSPDPHFNLGMALRQIGDRQRAAIHLERFLALAPPSYAARRSQAEAWLAETAATAPPGP